MKTLNPTNNPPKARRGALLLFLLGMIVLMSLVLTNIIDYAQARFVSRASDMVENPLRLDAYNALYAVVAELEEFAEIDGGFFSEKQGWGTCFSQGRVALPSGSEVSVKVSDMQDKISISGIPYDDFKKILEELGFSELEAQTFADCYFDWIDSDDAARQEGAEKDDYDEYSPKPPNRPMESFGELRYIKGFSDLMFDENGRPNEMYKTFTKLFSLEGFNQTNINSASPEVLAILCQICEISYEPKMHDAINGLNVPLTDGIFWVKNSSDVSARGYTAPPRNICYQSSRLKIEIRIKRGLGEFFLSAIYAKPTSGNAQASKSSIGNPETSADTKSGFCIVEISERAESD